MCRKSVPHTGISFEPCAAGSAVSPLMVYCTCSAGNLPPFFREIWVKSDGDTLRALAAGPSPLPAMPWQTAQYSWYRSLPARDCVMCTCALAAEDSLSPGDPRNSVHQLAVRQGVEGLDGQPFTVPPA